MSDDLTIAKANNFVQASYSMTLDEMRILALSLGVFNPKNPTKRDFEFTIDDFCNYFPEVNRDIAYTQVQNAIRKISRRWMTLRDDEDVLDEVVFVTDRTYFKKEGRFKIVFHERLMPYIAELHDRYTEYKLMNIGSLASTHAIRLYELFSQYRDTGWRQISLADLKNWLQVSNKYTRFNNFHQRVLNPSIAEINAKTDLIILMENVKRGRVVVGLKFTIKNKNDTNKQKLYKIKRPPFPHKSKYGFARLDRKNPKMSTHEYGLYTKDCLKILENFYNDIKEVTTEDLRNYWVFLAGNDSNKSKLGNKQDFLIELRKRGYKIVDCELVNINN